jgi:uncharacterized protein (TIGR02266 family)
MTQQPFDYSNVPRDSRRVPIATKVAFKFERFSGFISEFSSNISPTGMFITTKTPEPPGSMLDFEFRLGDGFEIIQGKGEVVWTRAIAEGPNRPPGMGIRFLDLGEGSKELIYRIVDQYIQDGGTPFDVSLRPPDPIPTPLAFPEPAPFPDLPDSGSLPPVDSSAWLPPVDGLDPLGKPLDDDFPPFVSPLPPMDDPEPARPTLAFSGLAAASAPDKKPRTLLLVVLGLALALAAAGYLFRDSLMRLAGLGGEDVAAVTPPARPPVRQQAPPSAAPAVKQEETPAGPLPEVVRRKPPAPTPAPTPPAAPPGPALSVLEKITWEESFGGTDVILWGNGAIRPEVYSESRMGDPPRELIRLVGIARSFPTPRVAVGTGEVKQVRTGFHEKAGGNELHIVIDLAGPGVKVTRIDAQGNQLRIHLQRQ